jgi:hypothetical protein
MNAQLRNLRINRKLSEETDCFSATLYLDGKKAAEVGNRGQGGPNEYHWVDRATETRATQYAESLPPVEFHGTKLSMDLDLWIANLLQAADERKQKLGWCKKATMFRLKGDDPGVYRSIAVPFTANVKAHLVAKHGGQLEEILNETLAAE